MEKRQHILLDLFLLLSGLEGLACLLLVLSIPGDPKNGFLFGLSIQRLMIAGALAVSALVHLGLIYFHRKNLGSGADRFSRIITGRKSFVVLHMLYTVFASVGLPVLLGSSFSAITNSAFFIRIAPLLGWMGLTGLEGLILLFWIDIKEQTGRMVEGLRSCFTAVVIEFAAAILVLVILDPVRSGLFFDTDLILLGILVIVLFTYLFNLKSGTFPWIGLLAALVLFIVPLIGIYASGASDLNFLSGLFPFNDAHGYYLGARHIVDGNPMNIFAARRPLFPAFLGFLLGISSQNLMVSILILVILGAIATFLFAQEIRNTHSNAVAAFTFLLLYLFFRRFIGSTMTETQGLAMGALGFAVLWKAVSRNNSLWFFIGLACLSIALNVRAGPFFVLPAIVVWGAFGLTHKGWISWKKIIVGILIIGLGFLGNFVVFKAFAPEKSIPFSNFADTLYGTAVGGKGWKQIQIDHPEISRLEEPYYSNAIYSFAFDEIKRNPAGLVQGSFVAWKSLFSLDFYGMFGFIKDTNPDLTRLVRFFLFCLTAIGFIYSVVRWKSRMYSFLLSAAAGVWISVPFVPPLDGEIRTYATVIPIFVVFAGLGLETIRLFILRLAHPSESSTVPNQEEPQETRTFSGVVIFTLALCLAAILGPLAIKASAVKPVMPAITCPVGEEAVYVRVNPGSYIQVIDDQQLKQTWLPKIRWTDFSKSIHDFPFYEITRELEPVAPPTTIAFTYDLYNYRHVWLIADTRLFSKPTGLFAICGTWTPNYAKDGYGFFYGKSIQSDEMGLKPDD